MLKLSQFTAGGRKPTGLLNGSSVLGPIQTGSIAPLDSTISNCKTVTTPAVVAGVLTTILSLSGRGCISFLACSSVNSSARTHRLKVTLDSVVIFDATSIPIGSTTQYCPAIGSLTQTSNSPVAMGVVPRDLDFNESLLVEYASSLSETGGTYVGYAYFPRA